jgi:hypothetical protein
MEIANTLKELIFYWKIWGKFVCTNKKKRNRSLCGGCICTTSTNFAMKKSTKNVHRELITLLVSITMILRNAFKNPSKVLCGKEQTTVFLLLILWDGKSTDQPIGQL